MLSTSTKLGTEFVDPTRKIMQSKRQTITFGIFEFADDEDYDDAEDDKSYVLGSHDKKVALVGN